MKTKKPQQQKQTLSSLQRAHILHVYTHYNNRYKSFYYTSLLYNIGAHDKASVLRS